MPDYARRYRTSTLIMVPIDFWHNSDPSLKKNIFLDKKLIELEHFFVDFKTFNSKTLNIIYGPKMFENIPWPSWMSLTNIHNNHFKIFHTYNLSITSICSRAQCAGPPLSLRGSRNIWSFLNGSVQCYDNVSQKSVYSLSRVAGVNNELIITLIYNIYVKHPYLNSLIGYRWWWG